MAFSAYTVYPRYTPGSPAQVPEDIAKRVALQEAECFKRALEGVYGEAMQAQANAQGLVGIVGHFVDRNRGKYTERTWLDLCTGEQGVDKLQAQDTWTRFGPRCGMSAFPPGVSNALCNEGRNHKGKHIPKGAK